MSAMLGAWIHPRNALRTPMDPSCAAWARGAQDPSGRWNTIPCPATRTATTMRYMFRKRIRSRTSIQTHLPGRPIKLIHSHLRAVHCHRIPCPPTVRSPCRVPRRSRSPRRRSPRSPCPRSPCQGLVTTSGAPKESHTASHSLTATPRTGLTPNAKTTGIATMLIRHASVDGSNSCEVGGKYTATRARLRKSGRRSYRGRCLPSHRYPGATGGSDPADRFTISPKTLCSDHQGCLSMCCRQSGASKERPSARHCLTASGRTPDVRTMGTASPMIKAVSWHGSNRNTPIIAPGPKQYHGNAGDEGEVQYGMYFLNTSY